MKSSVVIKSNPYGISLIFDTETDFEDLVRELCTKFAESRAFWGKASLCLSLQGRSFSDQEVSILVEAIEINSDITITLVEENNATKERQMLEHIDSFYFEKAFGHAKIIKGNVPKGQEVKSECSVLILGDIKAGATVTSDGCVIVLGSLEGRVHAGAAGNRKAFIVASELLADTVTIAGNEGTFAVRKKWQLRSTKPELMAVVLWHGELCCEPLKSGMVKHIS